MSPQIPSEIPMTAFNYRRETSTEKKKIHKNITDHIMHDVNIAESGEKGSDQIPVSSSSPLVPKVKLRTLQ